MNAQSTNPAASAFPAAEAARLLDHMAYGEGLPKPYADRFDLVAAPWQPAESLQRGDVVISRPAATHAAEVAVVADCAPAHAPQALGADRIVLRLREEAPSYGRDPENVGAVVGVISDVVGMLGPIRELSGDYKLTTQDAFVTPYSRNDAPMAPFRTRIEYTLKAHHPRYGVSNPDLVFYVDMVSDCLNIYSVQIQKDDGRSSELYLSTFEINFRPNVQQPPGFGATAIDYAISGRWDPFGRGDRAFSGRLVVMADGRMKMFQIQPRDGWVQLEAARRLEGRVACPPPSTPAPGSAPQAPAAPPPDPRPSATDALRARLPSGPNIEHVFFTTNTLELTAIERNRLSGWFNRLPTPLQRQITRGELTVYVDGHASPGGTYQANLALSTRRAEAAAAALRPIVGPDARIHAQGFGSHQAIGTPGSNDQADRRATVRIVPAR